MFLIRWTPGYFVVLVWASLLQTGVGADKPSSDSARPGQSKAPPARANFHGTTFKDNMGMPATFADADVTSAVFQGVETWSSFRNASLREAIFKESSLVGVDFRDANLEMARFVKCVMPAARLLGANCSQVTFTNCGDICGADFGNGNLDAARFVNCRLPAARFVAARCRRINFTNCEDLCGLDFSDADIEMSRFVNCHLPAARFVGANCRRANFVNCGDLCGADFSDADLELARFANCDGPAARFVGAKCRQTCFDHCRFASGTNFTDADLELATFTCCELSTARLSGASFKATIFRSCDLSGVDFRDIVFAECSLIDPNLRGADLRGVDLRTSLQGGQFDSKTCYSEATQFPLGFDPVAKGLTLRQTAGGDGKSRRDVWAATPPPVKDIGDGVSAHKREHGVNHTKNDDGTRDDHHNMQRSDVAF